MTSNSSQYARCFLHSKSILTLIHSVGRENFCLSLPAQFVETHDYECISVLSKTVTWFEGRPSSSIDRGVWLLLLTGILLGDDSSRQSITVLSYTSENHNITIVNCCCVSKAHLFLPSGPVGAHGQIFVGSETIYVFGSGASSWMSGRVGLSAQAQRMFHRNSVRVHLYSHNALVRAIIYIMDIIHAFPLYYSKYYLCSM
jgi:hypothetical protein